MIPEPGDTNREVPMNETFHVQTDDELTEKELKQIEADDQAIQTILLGLSKDIYAAVDSCETAQEIWLRVQQMMKGFDIGIQEKKAKLFNEWERFTSNERESIESYYCSMNGKGLLPMRENRLSLTIIPEWSRHVTIVHQTKDLHTADYTQLYDFLKYNQKEVDELKAKRLTKILDPLVLMANSNNPYAFPAPHQDQPSFNQNYMQQPMPNPEDIIDPTTAMNMALTLIMTLETHNWLSSVHQELHKIVKDENFPIVNQVDARVQNFEIHFLKEAAKFVGDFKSLAKEADESLAKHKALELEIERLLRAVVSQDIMSVVQKTFFIDTSKLQTELERTKERFETCIIKKENEYAKLWNDWYKKCD
nr:hypothetical protein [Tanacetum cinerariifolium]